eukprot:CAMPEP_0198334166 /NCGR_PEP_ID=MMETSP1450-20131203/19439_1 /TAXON_ID=753684 ORGANISM="Madagascaria erythrocladiodes, Strain CCMP3234" /NCGR_SAMPLE_ID=MMETSP1450 /ASSEMBLY_ACC=CAM_ASM_001115 /LENGTH=109 /DNA_ID=CAMNT_0044038741 /DNA_START=104 /DNA_END=429 /DNA_ORIENTATION=+
MNELDYERIFMHMAEEAHYDADVLRALGIDVGDDDDDDGDDGEFYADDYGGYGYSSDDGDTADLILDDTYTDYLRFLEATAALEQHRARGRRVKSTPCRFFVMGRCKRG